MKNKTGEFKTRPRVLRAVRRADTETEFFLVILRAVSDKADSSTAMACAGSGGYQMTDVPLSSAKGFPAES